jgi:hypothetical protein
LLRLIVTLFIFTISVFAKERALTYDENDGVVAVEIEDAQATGNWKQETGLSGFSGNSYYTWKGSNQFNSPGKSVLEYKVIISKPGKYFLNIHNRHDFKDSTEENDCFTQMDDGKWVKTFSSKRGEWTWHSMHEWSGSKKINAEYDLTAGSHTFRISGRSHGFSIDRFHLAHESVKKKFLNLSTKLSRSGLPSLPKNVTDKKILSYWKNNKLGLVVRECNMRLKKGEDSQATTVLKEVESYVAAKKSKIDGLKKISPSMAYVNYKKLAALLSYTDYEKQLRKEIYELSKDREFQKAIQAEKTYLRAVALLNKKSGRTKAPSSRTIKEVVRLAKDLKKRYPDLPFYSQLEQSLNKMKVKLD